MSRGKHAASKNAQLLREARAEIEDLKASARHDAEASHARQEELKEEIRVLSGRLVSEVDRLAADHIAAAQAEARDEIEDLRRKHRSAILKAFEYIAEVGHLRLPLEGHFKLSDILDVDLGDMFQAAGADQNRQVRRMTKRKAHSILPYGGEA